MNDTTPPFIAELAGHLRGYLGLCEEALALAGREKSGAHGRRGLSAVRVLSEQKILAFAPRPIP
jgi:hypothetical protein